MTPVSDPADDVEMLRAALAAEREARIAAGSCHWRRGLRPARRP
jgi:hypothetical protein